MKSGLFLLVLLTSIVSGCPHTQKEMDIEEASPTQFGAAYISCEPIPWQFTLDGIMTCEFTTPAPSEINPENACAFTTIQEEPGDIELNFSNTSSKGRLVVRSLNNAVQLKDQNESIQTEIYLKDGDHFFIEDESNKLKMVVENVYVGGCYHELIRWETK